MKKKFALFALSMFTLVAGSTILFSCGEKGNLTGLKSKNDNIEIVYGEEFNVNDFQIYAIYESGETKLEEKNVSQDGFTYIILKNGAHFYGNINGTPDVGNYSFTIKYQTQSCLAHLVVSPATLDTTPSLVMSTTEFEYLAKYPSLSFSDSSVISPNAIIQYKYDKLDENGQVVNAGNVWNFSPETKNTELEPGNYQLYAIVKENGNYVNFTTSPVRFTVKKAHLSLQDYRLYKNGYNDITLEFNYDATKLTLKDYNNVLNEQITIMNAGSPVQFGTLEFVDGDTIVQAPSFSDGRKFSIVCKSASSKFEDLVYTDAIMLSITPISVEKPTGIAFSELDDEVTTVYNGEVHEITCFKLPQTRKTGTNIFVNDNDVEVFKITNDSSLSATNAGNYHVTFELLDKENFIWSDETTDDITFNWSITKKEISLTNISWSIAENPTYDGSAHNNTATFTTTDNVSVALTYSYTYSTTQDGEYADIGNCVNAGFYRASIASAVSNDENYFVDPNFDGSLFTTSWQILKATFTTPVATKTSFARYEEEDVTFTLDFNLTENELALVTLEDYSSSDFGNHNCIITIIDDNYEFEDHTQVYTIPWKILQAVQPITNGGTFYTNGDYDDWF